MTLFVFDAGKASLEGVKQTTFQAEGITEGKLQQALAADISPLLEDVLVICDERGFWVDTNRRVDLLCIDKSAKVVIVELKRDETAAQADLQALRYAAMVSAMSFRQLCEIHAVFLSERRGVSVSADEAVLEIRRFLNWSEDTDEAAFNEDVRIVLAASNFSKELTTTALWLNDKGIDLECVRMVPYRQADKILVDFHRVIPVPESDEFRIQLREKEEQKAIARRSARDYSHYHLNGGVVLLNKRRLALAVVRSWVEQHRPDNVAALTQAFPKTSEASRGLVMPISLARETGRHFMGDGEVVMIGGETYCVTNQWGIHNIEYLIEEARSQGFSVERAQ